MSIDEQLSDVQQPAVAAGILVARARSYAANGQHNKLSQTLEAVDRILSGMRDDATLPFVWRTVVPDRETRRGDAEVCAPFVEEIQRNTETRAPLIECIIDCEPTCSAIMREATTDTCSMENCSYLCGGGGKGSVKSHEGARCSASISGGTK